MATLTNATQTDTGTAVFKSVTLPAVSHSEAAAKSGYSSDELLKLNTQLQSTLDLEELFEIFSQQVRRYVVFDSMRFHLEPQVTKIKIGRDYPHSASYAMVSQEHKLGDVAFTRRKPFTAAESANLELLLRHLVYPLRNALLYRRALLDARKDPLTGMKNRAALDEAMQRELGLAKRYHTPLSIIILDIDHFKVINDSYGHSIGDCLLKQLAESTVDCIRRSDMLFRYGGEEFVILLNNTDIHGANRLAERVRRKIERLENLCGRGIGMTVSAGVATTRDSDNENSLFERADQALYRAKEEGRNRIAVAD